jgi:hypothetical protein
MFKDELWFPRRISMDRLIIIIALAALLLAGCGRSETGQQGPAPTPPPSTTPLEPTAPPPTDVTAADLQAQLSAAEQRWKDSEIASYRIKVLEVHSIWSAQRMTVTVNDGHVIDLESMCIPAPMQGRTCTIQPVEPSNFLVPALLRQARDLIDRQRPEHLQLGFDPALGYPTRIGFNNPEIRDGDYGLMVESFERLPGRPASELGQAVALRVGEAAQAEGLTITLSAITEDSRCPNNVDCAWAGQVVAELLVAAPGHEPETVQLTLMGRGMRLDEPTVVADAWRLQLTSVTPYPTHPEDIPTERYLVTVQVSKVQG